MVAINLGGSGSEHDVEIIYSNTISKLSRTQLGPLVARRGTLLSPFQPVTLAYPFRLHARSASLSLLSLYRCILTSLPDIQQNPKRNMDPGLGVDEVLHLYISMTGWIILSHPY